MEISEQLKPTPTSATRVFMETAIKYPFAAVSIANAIQAVTHLASGNYGAAIAAGSMAGTFAAIERMRR